MQMHRRGILIQCTPAKLDYLDIGGTLYILYINMTSVRAMDDYNNFKIYLNCSFLCAANLSRISFQFSLLHKS